jgi:hypothetical protein
VRLVHSSESSALHCLSTVLQLAYQHHRLLGALHHYFQPVGLSYAAVLFVVQKAYSISKLDCLCADLAAALTGEHELEDRLYASTKTTQCNNCAQ